MSKRMRNWIIGYSILFVVLVVGMMLLDIPWYAAVVLTAVGMIYQTGRYLLWD
ncbi:MULTISPECIES: hypothetical protein [Herpetosiphon]|jgi:hypothetical protein|uniref:Uncharacterized protein n=1 Tax=Herpetosiphon gulosus TaxID=1973496 RepID=A0ABP9X583_9CHLR|nr:hypothetical protein [Herpetosiphon sp.]MCA0355183.1 hypothetical protein [Chloroflexota bacterium]